MIKRAEQMFISSRYLQGQSGRYSRHRTYAHFFQVPKRTQLEILKTQNLS
jgi:hypothetical protein